jgi:hypothetical protein
MSLMGKWNENNNFSLTNYYDVHYVLTYLMIEILIMPI